MAGKPRHGMSRTRMYRCWSDMKSRCNNKANKFYARYGGRGICYCDEWEHFEPFYEWAVNNGYEEHLTLERVDNDMGYSPGNCKWATQQEQSLNKTHLPSKTGYVGVRKRKNRYSAEVYRNMKCHHIGLFKTPEEANEARLEFLRRFNIDNRRGFSPAGGQTP